MYLKYIINKKCQETIIDKFTKEEGNFNFCHPHPFTIIKFLLSFIITFLWYIFVTKTDILDLFYKKVVDCQKSEIP